MSDFVSEFWNLYVVVISLVSIIGCGIFLKFQSVHKGSTDTTGHVWDETLAEYNNPLPAWWKWMFYITIVFALVYLALYPGLGKFQGVLGWSSVGQYKAEVKKADDTYGPIYDKYLKMDLKAVAADKEANEMGKRLFLTYCSQCHGSDARGSKGFPNLADADWQWGGEADTVKTTILEGRNGVMPPHAQLGDETIKNLANFVRSLSGLPRCRAGRQGQGSLRYRRLHRLPWSGSYRHPGSGRPQPDRQGLAVRLLRGHHHRDHQERPQQPHAGLEGLPG